MNSKNKWLLWAVVILIVANIAVLGTIWYLHHNNEHRPNGPAEFLAKELNFNDQQKEQLHQMENEHHRQAEMIQREIKEARDSFFNLLSNAADTINKKLLSGVIASKLQQLELMTFDHFAQVRNMCTPEQQKKFDQIIHHVLEMMAPPREREPYGHERGPHGPPPPPDR